MSHSNTSNNTNRLKVMMVKTLTAWVEKNAPAQSVVRDFGLNQKDPS